MPDLPPPPTYHGRLIKVQRIVRAATYRHDPKIAMREVCEALTELTAALIEHEEKINPPDEAAK